MIKPKFLFLLAISVTSWGYHFQTLPTADAQTPPKLEQSQIKTVDNYYQLMRAGYEAAAQGKYQLALEKFEQALAQRPSDTAAENAITDMEKFLDKTSTDKETEAAPEKEPSTSIPIIPGVISLQILVDQERITFLSVQSVLLISLLGASLSLLLQYRRPKRKSSKYRQKTTYINPQNALYNFFRRNGNSFAANKDTKTSSDISSDINGNGEYDFNTSLPVPASSQIPNVDLILRLIESLRDNDPRNRRRAVWKLAQMSDSRAMQPLVDSMVAGDSVERSLTLEALSQICTRSLRPMNQALAISLQDKNPQVRKNAIRDLTRLYEIMTQISQLICLALDDSDEEVQETARWAIRQLNLQLPPRLEMAPLQTTGEPEDDDDVQDTSYSETTATDFTETTATDLTETTPTEVQN